MPKMSIFYHILVSLQKIFKTFRIFQLLIFIAFPLNFTHLPLPLPASISISFSVSVAFMTWIFSTVIIRPVLSLRIRNFYRVTICLLVLATLVIYIVIIFYTYLRLVLHAMLGSIIFQSGSRVDKLFILLALYNVVPDGLFLFMYVCLIWV